MPHNGTTTRITTSHVLWMQLAPFLPLSSLVQNRTPFSRIERPFPAQTPGPSANPVVPIQSRSPELVSEMLSANPERTFLI